jgi:hypothetical protein
MYDIEPMPDKLEVEFDAGESQDQAFLGDPYALKIKFKQEENIKLKSISAVVMDIQSAPMGYLETIEESGGSLNDSIMDNMHEVTLSTNPSMSQLSSRSSRLSTSLFSSEMSMLYRNPNSSRGGLNSS